MEFVVWVSKYWIEVVFGMICTAFGIAYKKLSGKIKKRTIEDNAMKEGQLALLDDSMGSQFRYCKDKNRATKDEFRRYERMYNAYHILGGNGAVTNEFIQFKKLEIREE